MNMKSDKQERVRHQHYLVKEKVKYLKQRERLVKKALKEFNQLLLQCEKELNYLETILENWDDTVGMEGPGEVRDLL